MADDKKIDRARIPAKNTREQLVSLAKGGAYNMDQLKADASKMEPVERVQLLKDLDMEKKKLDVGVDFALLRRLNELEAHVQRKEQTMQETVGSVLNTGIDSIASGAKKGTEFIGNQVKKGTDAMGQIGEQAVSIMNDPNISKETKRVQVLGLAAAVAVPAGFLYWALNKMAGKGLKPGEKPSVGRRILQVTGFAFLASLGVRAIAPLVSEQQKKLIESKSRESKIETITPSITFDGAHLQIDKKGDKKTLVINGIPCTVNVQGGVTNLMNGVSGFSIVNGNLLIQHQQGNKFHSIFVGPGKIASIVEGLKPNGSPVLYVHESISPGGQKESVNLEFKPEKTSSNIPPLKEELTSPETKAPQETVIQSFEFDGNCADIVERNGVRLLRVGEKTFKVAASLRTPDLGIIPSKQISLPVMQTVRDIAMNVEGGLTINQSATVSKEQCAYFLRELSDATQEKSITVKATVDGKEGDYTFECTPENLS